MRVGMFAFERGLCPRHAALGGGIGRGAKPPSESTGASIVDLLLTLNREQGSTLLLVTHDPALAGRAERVVALRDGRILP